MELQILTAISPVDGRYRDKVAELGKYFSEFALIKYRLFVEIEYFIALTEIPLPQLANFPKQTKTGLRNLHHQFSLEDANRIKEIEKITNHDVKAVEYFLKEKFDLLGLDPFKEFIHFGLTSQDINNTAVPCSIQDAIEEVYLPALKGLVAKLVELSDSWSNIPMLAKTHGQPASPTILGKEIKVFVERLEIQLDQLVSIPCYAKFGGATGNFNAHHVAYPAIDWVSFANRFVHDALKLERSQTTTQIAHYDNYAAIFDCLKRINTILIDLDRDFWSYVSMNYFKQQIKKGEIGSSAMPHKVNPIDFENSYQCRRVVQAFAPFRAAAERPDVLSEGGAIGTAPNNQWLAIWRRTGKATDSSETRGVAERGVGGAYAISLRRESHKGACARH